jgi:hypothetical protein
MKYTRVLLLIRFAHWSSWIFKAIRNGPHPFIYNLNPSLLELFSQLDSTSSFFVLDVMKPMTLKLRRNTKFLFLVSLFCISFLLILNPMPHGSLPVDPDWAPISEVPSLHSQTLILPWGDNNGTVVTNAASTQILHQTISDGMDGVIVVWRDFRNSNNDIYAQRVDSDGNPLWGGNGTAICTDSASQNYPALCTDGMGGAFIVWVDTRDSNDTIYIQHINSTGHVQWATNGIQICNPIYDQSAPKIASDGQGGAYVFWVDQRLGPYNIFGQRINGTGTPLWTADGVAIISDSAGQSGIELIPDGSNNTILAWEDERGTTGVWAQKVDPTGSEVWTSNGVKICDEPGMQFGAQLASDGAGGAILVWNDYRSGTDMDVFAQRISTSGLIQWTSGGIPICNESEYQYEPKIASDGAGGAIITWQDDRSTIDSDIYAQRVNGSGAIQWISQGVVVSNYSGDQDQPSIAPVGGGDSIITWADSRFANDDIFVQYLTSAGTPTAVLCAPSRMRRTRP